MTKSASDDPPSAQNPRGLPRWMTRTGTVAGVAAATPLTILTAFDVVPWVALLVSLLVAVVVLVLRSSQLNRVRSLFVTIGVVAVAAFLTCFTVVFGREREDQDRPRPLATAYASSTSGFSPLRVVFDASGSRGQTTKERLAYAWDLDGNGPFDDATIERPDFVYDAPGTYAAQVRVTGANRESSVSRPITVRVRIRPTPTPTASAAPTSTEEPQDRTGEIVFEDTPATSQFRELGIAVGEEADIDDEAALGRLVFRVGSGRCDWTIVRTGDRFFVERGRLRFQIDADQVGSRIGLCDDAKLSISRQLVADSVKFRCRKA